MKQNYFMLAAAAMMFAACSQSDLVDEIQESAPQAIEFSTFANKTTRAVENNDSAAYSSALEGHHTTFNVWASKKLASGSYIDVYADTVPGKVSYSSQWTATPLKFWDKTAESYAFYAAAPADLAWVATNTAGANGTLSLANFLLTGVNNTASESWKDSADIDLMIADTCTTYKGDYSTVDLNFIHILSRLNIKVKSSYNDADSDPLNDPVIMLTGLNVCGLKNKGTFNEATAAVPAGTTDRWANLTEYGTYTLAAKLPSTQLTSTPVLTHKYLIIPQAQKNVSASANVATAPSGEAYIQIQYTVDGEPYETYYSLAQAFGIAQNSYLNFKEGWQNTLTIDIDPNVISFTGKVATWGTDAVAGDVTIN